MDKELLKILRKMKVKTQEITIEERQKIKEYVDEKKYSIEKLEFLKIEMQVKKNKKYSVVFPVILSIFATLIFEATKISLGWVRNFVYNDLQIKETYALVKNGLAMIGIATEENKKGIIVAIFQIIFAYFLFFLCFLLAIFAFYLVVEVILFLLGGGLHAKDEVYQYYYEEYISERINQLKQGDFKEQHNEESLYYAVNVRDEKTDKKYDIYVTKQKRNDL